MAEWFLSFPWHREGVVTPLVWQNWDAPDSMEISLWDKKSW